MSCHHARCRTSGGGCFYETEFMIKAQAENPDPRDTEIANLKASLKRAWVAVEAAQELDLIWERLHSATAWCDCPRCTLTKALASLKDLNQPVIK
jgi:hypothetical protein